MSMELLTSSSGVSQASATYVDDVFSAYAFTSPGASSVSTRLNTGINLAMDTDPDWQYVRRLLPLLSSYSYDAALGTHIGGNLNFNFPTISSPFGTNGISNRSARFSSGGQTRYSSYSLPTPPDYNSSWCIEGWGFANGLDSGSYIHDQSFGGTDFVSIAIKCSSGESYVSWSVVRNSSYIANGTAVVPSGWHYVAMRFNQIAGILEFRIDGISYLSTLFGGWTTQPPNQVNIGCYAGSDGIDGSDSGLCQVRYTFGSSRESEKSLVPTKPFPTCGNPSSSGGLAWFKSRSTAVGHSLVDTYTRRRFDTQDTNIFNTDGIGFDQTGVTIQSIGQIVNPDSASMISWFFKENPNFFDIVTYSGNGTTNNVTHNLGSTPGMIFSRNISSLSEWAVIHRGNGGDTVAQGLSLNSNAGAMIANSAETNIGTNLTFNANAVTSASGTAMNSFSNYVAYLFAHDPSPNGLIQCGRFSIAGSDVNISLGWEPQFLLIKRIDIAADWLIYDTARDLCASTTEKVLKPNLVSSESTTGSLKITATGLTVKAAFGTSGSFIYMAIRRSNKPPSNGSQVFEPVAYTGGLNPNPVRTTGLTAPDVFWAKYRTGTPGNASHNIWDKMRGIGFRLFSDQVAAEQAAAINSFDRYGVTLPTSYANTSGTTYIGWFLKRAMSVFDIVCYTGTAALQNLTHQLGVAPELMIIKARSGANAGSYNWYVYHTQMGPSAFMNLNLPDSQTTGATGVWGDTAPTVSQFTVGTTVNVNNIAHEYVAYLFASRTGISKVGTYPGNGTTLNVDCSFTAGARLVLIKRVDASGDWLVWDTARGIVASADPFLRANTTAAEITTDDSIDPYSAGFTINQNTTTNINVNGATYIFLAIA